MKCVVAMLLVASSHVLVACKGGHAVQLTYEQALAKVDRCEAEGVYINNETLCVKGTIRNIDGFSQTDKKFSYIYASSPGGFGYLAYELARAAIDNEATIVFGPICASACLEFLATLPLTKYAKRGTQFVDHTYLRKFDSDFVKKVNNCRIDAPDRDEALKVLCLRVIELGIRGDIAYEWLIENVPNYAKLKVNYEAVVGPSQRASDTKGPELVLNDIFVRSLGIALLD